MLKGYTKIELTDVHTGEKEVVEKHNLVTDNLSNILNYLPLGKNFSNIKNQLFPTYEKIMGGIILFSNPLEENVNNVLLPSGAENPITGYASNDVNAGNDEKRGSRNLSESINLDNGYKYVWDFGTAEANGIISAVSLCNADACKNNPFYNSMTSIVSFSANEDIANGFVEYDFDNDVATCILTIDATTVLVKTYSFGTKKISFEGPFLLKSRSTKNIVSPINLVTGGSWRLGDDGYYYYYKYESTTSQYIARMKKDTLTIDTTFGLKKINANVPNSYADLFCIANGYLYLSYSDFKRVNLSNVSDITKIGSYEVSGNLFSYKGIVYASSHIFFSDDTSVKIKDNMGYTRVFVSDTGKYAVAKDKYLILGYLNNNLCTINNLEKPVTKTADKTMKITYTITEE